MTRKKLNKTIIHIILLAFAAAALPACDDLYHSAQKQIKNSKSFSFLATVLGMGLAPYQARGLSFIDAHPEENTIGGNIIIQPAKDESLVQFYWAYYGSSPTTMLDEEFGGFYIAQCIPNYNGTPAVMSIPNTGMPIGATHILIYSVDFDFNMLPRPTALKIPDMVQRPIPINPVMGSNPHGFTIYDNLLFFNADDGSGPRLWLYDGDYFTPALYPVDTASDYAQPEFLHVYDNQLYFSAASAMYGTELFRAYFNGGIYIVENAADIATDAITSSYPSFLTTFQNRLYFQAVNGANGTELWSFDEVYGLFPHDINPGGPPADSLPSDMIVYGGMLYFAATRLDVGRELFRFDGFMMPNPVAEINASGDSSPSDFVICNGLLYFTADDGGGNGRQIYSFNGNMMEGPQSHAVVWPLNPDFLTVYNNKIYFKGNDPGSECELWFYDPLMDLYTEVDLDNGIQTHTVSDLVVFNNKLYFNASEGAGSLNLWVWDENMDYEYTYRTNPGPVSNIAGASAFNPTNMKVYNNGTRNLLIMQADDGVSGDRELWEYFIRNP